MWLLYVSNNNKHFSYTINGPNYSDHTM